MRRTKKRQFGVVGEPCGKVTGRVRKPHRCINHGGDCGTCLVGMYWDGKKNL